MESPAAYIPMDRRQAMAMDQNLADRTNGAALFADVSGFTPLTEALVRELGQRRAAEELTKHLNAVYGALIAEVHRYGGSVVSFAGDAITCWFDAGPSVATGRAGLQATACALAMQRAMDRFAEIETRSGSIVSLAIKTSIAAGSARRFLIGDPQIQVLDVMAGATLDRMASADHLANQHEVVVGPQAMSVLENAVEVAEWRDDFALVSGLAKDVETAPLLRDWARIDLPEEAVLPWILPPIYERLQTGQGRFLAELRPGVALFLRFGGIDYDRDDAAGERLDAYVQWVQNVLAQYEGYLLQLIVGDKGSYLYGAFGAPLAHDDDATRAVAAAMDLLSPPSELSYITGVQIGVSQGQMRAGAYGGEARRTYGVLGDEVTAAARLMGYAQPGQVLVSEGVAAAAGKSYRFELLGSVRLKGKSEPVPAYCPLERRVLSPQRPATIFSGALVGRDDELARMEQVLASAADGEGQVLCVQGVAGVGKSHLAAEFVERAVSRGLRVAVGACQSTSRGIAYTPWRQAFRALFGLMEGAGPERDGGSLTEWQIAQVEAAMRRMNPDWLVRLPLLGDLLDLPIPDNETTAAFDPQLRQESLFALTVEIVQAWAGDQPLLLLVEDAHWMDEASLGLTVALGRVIADDAVLLVVVQRPPVQEGQSLLPELERLPFYHFVDLNVLSPEGVEALVSNRLQGLVSPLALALIQAQAQGNPFFTEELVDALRESRRLWQQDDGTWGLSEPMVDGLRRANCLIRQDGEWVLVEDAQLSAANLGIPDSIHGIVLSRIDRLPEAHKLTLKVASVIGRAFEFDLLVRSHPLHPVQEDLLEQIEILQAREFARLEAPPPQRVYLFKHNITQEVVYRTLLEDQQRELHQAVGEALEGLQPEAVEQLAYHYSHSDVRDKTIFYLDRAARKTQREYANETALNYYNRALDLEERWQWRKGQIEVLHILGRREEEQAGLSALYAAPGAPAFDVAYLWGQYYESTGDYAQAQNAVERAIVACQDCDDVLGQARCLSQLGQIARRQGDFERAKERYRQALRLFDEREIYPDEEAHVLAQALNGLGRVYHQQGDFGQARVSCEQALALSRQSGNRTGEGQALSNLGGTAFHERNFAEAMTYHRQALDVWRVIGDRAGEGISLYSLALGANQMGDYGQAEIHYSDALTVQQAVGNRWEEVNVWMGLGVLYQELGDLPRAQSCLEQGLQLARDIGDRNGQAYMLGDLGLVMRDQGDLQSAEKLLNDGLALAEEQSAEDLVSHFVSHLGIVSLMADRVDQAIERASAAVAQRRKIGQSLSTTADLATLAAAYQASGNSDLALDCAREALAILDECEGEGESPQRDYFVCYETMARAGETETALSALQSAYSLVLRRADKITDPALRQSFLERVPINREIVREAARQGIKCGD